MKTESCCAGQPKGLNIFEKYLTIWVLVCIVAGILLGRFAPGAAKFLDGLAIYVGEAPVVSIPIAICLFFMMYPIMVKIDFAEVIKAGKTPKPVLLTLFLNWGVKPFTMIAIANFFLGYLFLFFHQFFPSLAQPLVYISCVLSPDSAIEMLHPQC